MQGIVTESFHYFLLFQTCAFFKKEREWEKYLKTMLCMGRNAWEEYYSKVCRQGRKFHVILKNLKSLLEVVIVNNMQLHASPGHKSKRKLKNCNSKMYEFFPRFIIKNLKIWAFISCRGLLRLTVILCFWKKHRKNLLRAYINVIKYPAFSMLL